MRGRRWGDKKVKRKVVFFRELIRNRVEKVVRERGESDVLEVKEREYLYKCCKEVRWVIMEKGFRFG